MKVKCKQIISFRKEFFYRKFRVNKGFKKGIFSEPGVKKPSHLVLANSNLSTHKLYKVYNCG